jgi:hypothetical protein
VDSQQIDLSTLNIYQLFNLADKIGNKHYHRLTERDWENYLLYNRWRYIKGDFECGTTQVSKDWVKDNSGVNCPICRRKYDRYNHKTIDHKLPRSHYPWLSIEFDNLWVVCKECNIEKGDLNWFEYERYIAQEYPEQYSNIFKARPIELIKALKIDAVELSTIELPVDR